MPLTDTFLQSILVHPEPNSKVYTFNSEACTAKFVFDDTAVKYAEIIDRTNSITYSFPTRSTLLLVEPFRLDGNTSDFAFDVVDLPTPNINELFENVLNNKQVDGTPTNIVTMDLDLDSDVIANIETIAASQAVSFNAALINLIVAYSNSVINRFAV